MNKKRKIASLEIILLFVSIIAFAYMIGSEARVVSALTSSDVQKVIDELNRKSGGSAGGDTISIPGDSTCTPTSTSKCDCSLTSDTLGGVCTTSCDTSTNKIVPNHCGSGSNRCCVPNSGENLCTNGEVKTEPIREAGARCGNGGTCVDISVTSKNWCKSGDKYVLDKNKVQCPSGNFLGYGLCGIPELDGNGQTPICCSTEGSSPKSNPCTDKGYGCSTNCNDPGYTEVELSCGEGNNLKCCKAAGGPTDTVPGTSTPVPSWAQEVGNTVLGSLLGQSTRGAFGCKKSYVVGTTTEEGGKFPKGGCYSYSKGEYTPSEGNEETCKTEGHKWFTDGDCVQAPGSLWGGLLGGAVWSIVLDTGLQLIKSQTDEHDGLYDALTWGASIGGPVYGLVKEASGSVWGLGAGAAATFVVFLMTWHEEATQKKTFESVVWQPPLGGEFCELCNQMGVLPCSEYQCKSLGMACQLINTGTEEERCFWQNRNDVIPPEISPWDEALPSNGSYNYDKTENVNPPDKGVRITYGTKGKKCLPPYQPISFGVSLDEPGNCKVDYQQRGDYENMTYYFGGDSLFKYNHTQTMMLPGPQESGNLTYNNGDSFNMYVRCQDANGNANTADFVFQFCVDEGPDSTPPVIVSTDPRSGMPVAYNITTLNVNVYTNEEAKCKWSRHDQSYDVMNTTMSSSSIWGDKTEMNGVTLYKHIATLNGIESDKENKFYFRCMDKAKIPNKNTESYSYTLIGTTPLEITEIGPNETIKDNTDTVRVTLTAKTFGGYNEGDATCSFKQSEEAFNKYTVMFSTGGTEHSQELYLPEDTYTYDIRCVDLGGNADVKNTTFSVDVDNEAPLITRMYYENGYLKLNTNEKATCVYSTTDCTYYYKDGININAVDDTTLFTDWNTQTNLYIKCKDIYGNEPYPPSSCTVVARPYDIYIPVEETEE